MFRCINRNWTAYHSIRNENAEVGLVKFDFLGLKTLTVIQKAVKIIQASKYPDFNIETVELEQKKYTIWYLQHSQWVYSA